MNKVDEMRRRDRNRKSQKLWIYWNDIRPKCQFVRSLQLWPIKILYRWSVILHESPVKILKTFIIKHRYQISKLFKLYRCYFKFSSLSQSELAFNTAITKRSISGDGSFINLCSLSLTFTQMFSDVTNVFFHSPFPLTERHISIQTKLEGLEMLVDLNGGEFRKSSSFLLFLMVLNENEMT